MTKLIYYKFRIKFEPKDLWIGVYWNYKIMYPSILDSLHKLSLYICIIPMLPIILELNLYEPTDD